MVTKESTEVATPPVITGQASPQVIPQSEITDLILEAKIQSDLAKELGEQASGILEMIGATLPVQKEASLNCMKLGSSLLCIFSLFFLLDTTIGTKEPESRTVEEIRGSPSSAQVVEVQAEIL